MTDEDLRSSARRARTGAGDPLRTARALERAGQLDEAVATLVSARHDPSARAALGWNAFAPAGCGASNPVAPITAPPRVLWTATFDGRDEIRQILATPLAVVLPTSRRTIVLDATTGEALPPHPTNYVCMIAGDALLATRGAFVEARDLWTRDVLHTTPLPRPLVALGPGMFVSDSEELTAFDLPDPRKPPTRTWSRPREAYSVLVSPTLILTSEERRAVALDRGSGQPLWRARPQDRFLAADADAVLGGSDRATQLFDARTGKLLWSQRDLEPLALGSSTAVARARDASYAWLDRRTGRRLATSPGDIRDAFSFAKDVLYLADRRAPAIEAISPRGALIWRADLRELAKKPASLVASAPGRVYALCGRTLTCLAASDGRGSATPPPPAPRGRRGSSRSR